MPKMRMPSVMQGGHKFSQVPRATIERSTFDRSHRHLTTFDAGYLVPVYVDEALPGDTFSMKVNAFARLATPLKPLMDNLYMDTFFFAVPVRLVWDNWQKFNGEQVNPGDSTSFVVPVFNAYAPAVSSLSDYMGIPTQPLTVTHVSLFHRAYNLIYNQWFRDQNLVNSAVVDTDDGPDNIADYVLRRRGKRHDYFTSCLPWPQKGTAVSLPLGTTAPVVGTGAAVVMQTLDDLTFRNVQSSTATGPGMFLVGDAAPAANVAFDTVAANTGLATDLSNATAATINQLRQAFQVQKLLERDARGGTRYTEIIKAHFGVTSPDARLQRPEYLGGSSTPVIVSPIAQNSSTDATTPQGNLAGIGTVSLSGSGFTKSFTEHTIIIGLVSVRADLSYQQGLNRMFSRSTRYDYFWPALAHIGEQAVFRREIFMDASAADANVFGYQERYAEYRYKPSLVTGLFRSGIAGTLEVWHLAQNFSPAPTLNQTFIEENPDVDRVLAVPTEPHLLFDGFFKLTCARPMPVYGVPGFIDHF